MKKARLDIETRKYIFQIVSPIANIVDLDAKSEMSTVKVLGGETIKI